MKTHRTRSSSLIAFALLGASALELAAAEPAFKVTEHYTAQRRPRVAVLSFKDTNHDADEQRYGAAVEAMLVTYLKRKSQFVVVERLDTQAIWDEWRLRQTGAVRTLPDDPRIREALEKLDVLLLGHVTLLPMAATAATVSPTPTSSGERPHRLSRDGEDESGTDVPPDAPASSQQPSNTSDSGSLSGRRIEIDAKLLSRIDGRIIAAAQRSGPVGCLRSIVERLGVALEQEFLRPYYGKLTFRHTEPENVHVFLTPILLDKALDEEKPPIEYGTTVIIGRDQDIVEPWTADPTSYTVRNLLTGWYSIRLERPGYEGAVLANARFEARDVGGAPQVFDKETGKSLRELPREISRFVVHVDPLQTAEIDSDALGFTFAKLGSLLDSRIKRQYIDSAYAQKARRIFLFGKDELEINRFEEPAEYAEDKSCDLFDERKPRVVELGRTHVPPGQTFDLETFKGGELVIEDYKGEALPLGTFQVALWEPEYQLFNSRIPVHQESKPAHSVLSRELGTITLSFTGARPGFHAFLDGETTGQRFEMPLDFENLEQQQTLPVDTYTVSTDIPGLAGWRKRFTIHPINLSPPVYAPPPETGDAAGKASPPKKAEGKNALPALPLRNTNQVRGKGVPPLNIRVKTRLVVGGRLNALSSFLNTEEDDLYLDRSIEVLLDQLVPKAPEPNQFLASLQTSLKDTARQVASAALQSALAEGRAATANNPLTSALFTGLAAQAENELAPWLSPEPKQTPSPPTNKDESRKPEGDGNGKGTSVLPKPPPDPEVLRRTLADRLQDVDLLVLNDQDMSSIRSLPDLATLIEGYVTAGGGLLAYVGKSGDYTSIIGASLVVPGRPSFSKRFTLFPGESADAALKFEGKRLKLAKQRAFPRMRRFHNDGSWRILAYSGKGKGVRIVERGNRDQGGYVMVWFDRPGAFVENAEGGRSAEVEVLRSRLERHALEWARHQLQRRYGGSQQCAAPSPAAKK